MKNFSITALLLLTAAFSFGQAPKAALYTPNADVYVGFLTTSPDYGPHFSSYQINGGEVAYTKNLTPHWAVALTGAGVFGNKFQVRQYMGTLGPKYSVLTGRVRPYATAQIGYAYQFSKGMYAGDHHPPFPAGANSSEDGLTYRLGAGVDVQLTHRIYWRAIQWDVEPQPWARHTPFYVNFSSGAGYRF